MERRGAFLSTLALFAASACGPFEEPSEEAVALISDQAHDTNVKGFWFLPPMVPAAVLEGTLDTTLQPTVTIDALQPGGPVTIATYTLAGGPGGEKVKLTIGGYSVKWRSGDFALDLSLIYRIGVWVGGRRVGFADVKVVPTKQQLKTVDPNQYVGLVAGALLDVKFWANTCLTVTCQAADACHDAGTCVPETGTCTNPAKPDGTSCDDADVCTVGDACHAGVCGGTTCDPTTESCPQCILAPALAPSSLTFDAQVVGTTSAPQTVTLTNPGGANMFFSVSSSSTEFAVSVPLAPFFINQYLLGPGQSVDLSVTFAPSTTGARSGTLDIGSTGGAATVPLAGTGRNPAPISVAPTSVAFGAQVVGTTSAAQLVTITNPDTAVGMFFTVSSSSAEFAVVVPIAATIANVYTIGPGASVELSVAFTPAATGLRSGTLGITSSGGPAIVPLSGAGRMPASVAVAPACLDFGGHFVTTTAGPEIVTLTNTDASVGMFFEVASSSAEFTVDVPLTPVFFHTYSIGPGASVDLSVTFTPAAAGLRTGVLDITGSGGPAIVSLSGTGLLPAPISVTPRSLAFGNQLITTASTPRVVTITNPDAVASMFFSVSSSSDDYAVTVPLTPFFINLYQLGPGGSVDLTVTFTPAAVGPSAGTLDIQSSGGPATVLLSGTGVGPAPISVSATCVLFGDQAVGTTSSPQLVTITNPDAVAGLVFSVHATSPEFAVNVPLSPFFPGSYMIGPGASVNLSVTFTPSAGGPRAGTIEFSGSGGPAIVSLLGGVNPVPVTPACLDFGDHVISTQMVLPVTMTNPDASAPLAFTVSSSSPDFAVSVPLTPVFQTLFGQNVYALDPGASVELSVTFTRGTVGPSSGTLDISSSAGSVVVLLAGRGVDPAKVSVAPAALDFGEHVFSTQTVLPVTITNPDATVPLIFSVASSSAEFNVSVPLSPTFGSLYTIGPGASVDVSVTFTPATTGARTATLTIGGTGGQAIVPLAGTGIAPKPIIVAPTCLEFGDQFGLTTSAPQLVTIANPDTTVGMAFTVSSSSPDFAVTVPLSPTFGNTYFIGPGATVDVSVTFTPSAVGSRTGTLAIGGTGGAATVALSGAGTGPAPISVTPTSLLFGDQLVTTTSGAHVVTIANPDTANGMFFSISSSSTEFDISVPLTPFLINLYQLGPGQSVDVSVTFTPSALGLRTGELDITSSGGQATVALAGTGTSPQPISVAPASLSFGAQAVGTTSAAQPVTLANPDPVANLFFSVHSSSAEFVATVPLAPFFPGLYLLGPGASVDVSVGFAPSGTGPRTGTLDISGSGGNASVPLSGTGVGGTVP